MHDGSACSDSVVSQIQRSVCRKGKLVLFTQLFDVPRSENPVFQRRTDGFAYRGGRVRVEETAHAAADAAARESALVVLKTDNKLRCEFSGQSLVHKGVYPLFCSSAEVLFCRCQMLPKDVRFIASHIGASLMYSEDLMSVLVVNLNGIACNAHGDGLADVGDGDAVAMACL